MLKNILFSIQVFLFSICLCSAQPWDPDYISNASVKKYKSNAGFGLVRKCGEGKVDSIPAIYNYIYKYETKYGELSFVGLVDSIWYKLDFNEKPIKLPYKNYLGKGYFIETKRNFHYLYSVERGLIFIDSTNRFSRFVNNFNYYDCDEYMCSLEENNQSLYCFPTPDFKFNNINSYCLSNSEVITLSDKKVKVKNNNAKQKKYGLYESYLYSEGKEILPFVYDTILIENYCAFAKKNGIYEMYNGLNLLIGNSQLQPKAFDNGFIDCSKNGRHGLIDFYGKTILECKFDKVWYDKLTFAQIRDSLFCFDKTRLIHASKINSNAKVFVSGTNDFQPYKITDTSNNVLKNLFYYNSYTSKILDLANYDSTYFYDVYKDEYYTCVKKNGKFGVINFDNKIVLPIEYDSIGKSLIYEYYRDSVTFHKVSKRGKIGFISNSLNQFIPNEYDAVLAINEENRMMPRKFILRKESQYYLYDFKAKQIASTGFDTIMLTHDEYNQERVLASQNGLKFYIDSIGKKYFDFKNVEIRETENQVFLEERKLNKTPLNITPLTTINRIEDFNQDHSYAIVFCLNRYFVINKYGDMSSGFENLIEFFDYKNNVIFALKSKKSKASALYDFKGNEVGRLSKYEWTQHYEDTQTHEHYFVFKNSKNKMGLMNAKGELLLDCKYYLIYPNEKGHFDFWLEENDGPSFIDPLTIKPLSWSK